MQYLECTPYKQANNWRKYDLDIISNVIWSSNKSAIYTLNWMKYQWEKKTWKKSGKSNVNMRPVSK